MNISLWFQVTAVTVIMAILSTDTALAAKEKFERTKPHVNVGTIGHVNHAKLVVQAMSYVSGANLEANSTLPYQVRNCAGDAAIKFKPFINAKINGISPGARQSLIFTPGTETSKFIISRGETRKSALHGAILVVDATEGSIPPKTREHVLLARQAGVPSIVAFINNPQFDTEELDGVIDETQEFLTYHGYDKAAIILGDLEGALMDDPKSIQSIKDLIVAVEEFPTPQKDANKVFLMPVEDVFSISGRGIVATGRIETGRLKVGDVVEFVGGASQQNLDATVIEITLLEEENSLFPLVYSIAEAGDLVQITSILDGDYSELATQSIVIAEPGKMSSTKDVKMTVYILTKEEGGSATPFFKGYRPQFYFRTTDVTGEVANSPDIKPGIVAKVVVHADKYIPVPWNGLTVPICDPDTGETHAIGLMEPVIRHEP